MNKIINKDFYKKAYKKHGISAKGVHWKNKYTQYKRFEVLTKFISKDIKNSIIVDAGCGFGEYYNYLRINGRTPQKYIGIDIEKKMIDISSKRFPRRSFYQKDVLNDDCPYADYYVCSGGMNIMTIDEIEIFIKKSFIHSKKGFVFNFLKNITYNGVKQAQILDVCTSLTTKLKMKENYLDNDFTIFMVKP